MQRERGTSCTRRDNRLFGLSIGEDRHPARKPNHRFRESYPTNQEHFIDLEQEERTYEIDVVHNARMGSVWAEMPIDLHHGTNPE